MNNDSSNSIIIRKMRPDDLAAIVAITGEAWGDNTLYKLLEDRHGVIGGKGWKERKIADLNSFCKSRPENVLVAEKNGQVAGYITFSVNNEDATGHVLNNAVDPRFRGKGIGTMLNKQIIDHFRTIGLRIARVATMEHDKSAQRVYEKQGFKEIARSILYSMELK